MDVVFKVCYVPCILKSRRANPNSNAASCFRMSYFFEPLSTLKSFSHTSKLNISVSVSCIASLVMLSVRCNNYCGIKLLSHTMKLWEKVIECRV